MTERVELLVVDIFEMVIQSARDLARSEHGMINPQVQTQLLNSVVGCVAEHLISPKATIR